MAVLFTFSFSTAFAGAPQSDKTNAYAKANISKVYDYVADAQKKAMDAIDKAESDALYSIFAGKTSKVFGTTGTNGTLEISSEIVKGYYDSEVADAARKAVNDEASRIYGLIQEAINDSTVDYIYILTTGNRADATTGDNDEKKWTASNDEVGYNVIVEFDSKIAGANDKSDYLAIFDSGRGETNEDEIAKDAFAEAAAKKVTEINAIDPNAYVAKDQDTVRDLKTKAIARVNELASIVAKNSYAFNAIVAQHVGTIDLNTAITSASTGLAGMLNEIYTPAINEQPADGALADELKNLSLSADEPTQAAKLDYARKLVMNEFEKAIKDEYDKVVDLANQTILNETLKGSKANQTKINDAKAAIEQAEAEKAAATEIATYLVNACDDINQLITIKSNFAQSEAKFSYSAGWYYEYYNNDYLIYSPLISTPVDNDNYYNNLIEVTQYVQELKDEAAALKADIAIDGTTSIDVDEMLEDAIDATYKTGKKQTLQANTANKVLHARKHALLGSKCDLTVVDYSAAGKITINEKNYDRVAQWVGDPAKYEGGRLDEVEALVEDVKAAINAATTVAEADAAFLEAYAKYDAVLTKTEGAAKKVEKAYTDLQGKYGDQLEAELDYAIAGLGTDDATGDKGATYLTKLKADLTDEDVYTTDELTAKFNELVTEIRALKGKKALTEEKKALDERCKAYSNTTVTQADKDNLLTLAADIDEFNDYVTRITGATTGYTVVDYGLDTKIKAVAQVEDKAIAEQYKAINKDGKATLDEAAAVAALREAIDAYNDTYDEYYNGQSLTCTTAEASIAKLELDIEKAQVANVESMIAKLPATGAASADVKAARDAYAALTLCQKVSVADRYYDKLADLGKMGLQSVEALKITASSKATKGAMTISWRVKGDSAAADGFRIYRSTKPNKGFKLYFDTKSPEKTKYKNTKNLKKGKTYYYKVRAYKVVDGKTYFSDFSNKAYRKAK